jgi:rubrerythrin
MVQYLQVQINSSTRGHAMTGKEDLLQALVEAYIMEKGTREFYTLAASKSVAAAKKGFEELAAWENRHMIYLQSLYQSALDDRELLEFEEFGRKVPAPVTEGGMPIKDLEKKIEKFSVQNEKDALSLAITIEAKAYNFYKGLAAKAQDAQTKVIFEEMMAQETKHMEEINAIKKRLSSL